MTNNISEVILSAIEYGIDKKVSSLPFDKTIICTVTDIDGDVISMTNNGVTYQVKVKNNSSINLMDKVHLKIPANNMSSKYLEEDMVTAGNGSGGGNGGGTISANKVIGLTAYIENVIKNHGGNGGGTQIVKSTTMPQNQTSGEIWYQLKSYKDNVGNVTTY